MRQLGFAGGLAGPPLPGPAASPLGDALNAVTACAHAAITRFGLSRADLWPLPGRFGLARHLAPAHAVNLRQPGHRHARSPAATLTMTTTAPFPALTASP